MFTASMSCKPLVTTKGQATQGVHSGEWEGRTSVKSESKREASSRVSSEQPESQLRKSTVGAGHKTAGIVKWLLLAARGLSKESRPKQCGANRFTGLPRAATGEEDNLRSRELQSEQFAPPTVGTPNSSAESLVGLVAQVHQAVSQVSKACESASVPREGGRRETHRVPPAGL